jgi:hypothetical protein
VTESLYPRIVRLFLIRATRHIRNYSGKILETPSKQTMSTISIQLPSGLKEGIESLGKREGFSIEQFLAMAAGEKLAVMSSLDYLRKEASQGSRTDWDNYLASVPDVPPLPGDEI